MQENYISHNTRRLNTEQVKGVLKTLDIMQALNA
jgi:hypothetical protein